MRKRRLAPNVGDRVRFTKTLPYAGDVEVEGEVIDELSSQFTVETDDGRLEFCFIGDPWAVVS